MSASVLRKRGLESTLGMISGVALNAVAVLLAAKMLGPAGRGQMVALTLIPTTLNVLLGAGFSSAATFCAASSKADAPSVAGIATLWSLGVSVLAASVVWVAGGAASAALGLPPLQSVLAAGALAPLMLYQDLTSLVQGLGRFKVYRNARLLQGALVLAATVLVSAIPAYGTPLTFFGAWVFSFTVPAFVLVVWSSLKVGLSVDGGVFKRMVAYGLRAMWAQVWDFGNSRGDQLVVASLGSPTMLGVYATAVSLSELFFHIPNALAMAVFASSAEPSSDVRRETLGLLRKLAPMTLGLYVVSCVGLLVLVPTVLGPSYLEVSYVFIALGPGVVLLSSVRLVSALEMGAGRPGVVGLAAAASLCVTLVADLLLIPIAGAVGAGLASTLGYSVAAATIWRLHQKNTSQSSVAEFAAIGPRGLAISQSDQESER